MNTPASSSAAGPPEAGTPADASFAAGTTAAGTRAAGTRAVRVIATIARNDFTIWVRRPVVMFSTLLPSIMYVLVIYFLSVTVGQPPVAVVNNNPGPRAAAFVDLLANSGDFSARVLPADAAQRELRSLGVAAIITIPASFDNSPTPGTPAALGVEMNNVNDDIQGDLRRSLGTAISEFSRTQPGAPLAVGVDEHDKYPSDLTLAQYRMVPGLVLIILIAGVVNTGLAMGQEFERRTIKQLVLAPVPRWWLILGKIAGGWLTTVVVGGILATVGAVTGLLRPAGLYWIPTIAMMLIVGLAGAAIGIATGALVRRFQLVTSISVAISLYLFFLAGGISVLAFLPEGLQSTARFVPLYYGIGALEDAVFDSSVHNFARDAAIMLLFAAAATTIAVLSVRRPLTK